MRYLNNYLHKTTLFKKLIILLIGPIFYGLFRLSFLWPSFTEIVYSRSIFRIINQGLSTITGALPFSMGEFLLYSFIVFVAVYIIVIIVRSIKAKKAWWKALLGQSLNLLIVVSIIYSLFVGLWAFNYARQPLGESLGLDTQPATINELYSTCKSLAVKANRLRASVPEDSSGVFSPDFTKEDIMNQTADYYNIAAATSNNDYLGGSFGPVKPVVYSKGLSYAHITGIYFPFTGEANVNADFPMLLFPSTCLHEAAHQRGFAREDEANFLAYYIASYSNNDAVSYSGTMLALIHAMNKLYAADSELYYSLRETYSDGINRDLRNNHEFWQQFESPVSEVSKKVNNTFLQANMQHDGVKSYGRMVDLLIGLWRNNKI